MKKIIILLFIILSFSFINAIRPEQYELLDEMFIVHMNYFLSNDAVTLYGLPLTAYKVGDRARFGYSNPAEWGYLLQAYIAAEERNIISESNAIEKINISLNTMLALQQDPNQNYQKLFYPYYKVTNPAGNDIFPYHDSDVNIPSIDNGLLYMSLLITEGWAREIGNTEIENKARTIKDQMNFSIFLFTQGSNKYLAHLINANTGQLSSSKWDVYADEGGLMTLIAYFSDSINFIEYQELTNSQMRLAATWNNYTVKEAAWFNAMFTWGTRSISGFKVIGTNYSKDSFVQTVKAHHAYGDFISIDYPGFSNAMSQVGGTGRYTPPNLANQVPLNPPQHITPHAFFIPFSIFSDLDENTVNNLTNYISLLKNDQASYYHDSGAYPYGFEVIVSPYFNDTSYTGSTDGRNNFETLSEAYTVLSLFIALQYLNNSKDFYELTINVLGYEDKVNQALDFLYGCTCTEWQVQECGQGSCNSNEIYQTRSCIFNCNIEERCVYDLNCDVNIITVCKSGLCNYTTIQEAITDANPGETVYITDQGVYEENVKFGEFWGKSHVTLDCNGAIILGNGSISSSGISISKGYNCTIKNCIIKNYYLGFYNWDGFSHNLINNTVINNTYGFYMTDTDAISIIGNNLSDNNHSIYFYWHGGNHVIKDNVVENNKEGIILSWGPRDSIIKNNFIRGNYIGILSKCPYGDHPAYRNNYTDNYIINNTYGIETGCTHSNFFENNTLIQNYYGFYMGGYYMVEGSNTIYHNNLINNTIQAYEYLGNSVWNYNNEGNYWSDYDEPAEGCVDLDNSGVCDDPYLIDTDNPDNFPFNSENGWLWYCNDFDGRDYFNSSYITFKEEIYEDSCSANNMTLKEYYCQDNQIKTQNFPCSKVRYTYRCIDGACSLPLPQPTPEPVEIEI